MAAEDALVAPPLFTVFDSLLGALVGGNGLTGKLGLALSNAATITVLEPG